MTPGSFDPVTAREITGDRLARDIEAKARKDADSLKYDPPALDGNTYWEQVLSNMRRVVYAEQYGRRVERNKRKHDAERTG